MTESLVFEEKEKKGILIRWNGHFLTGRELWRKVGCNGGTWMSRGSVQATLGSGSEKRHTDMCVKKTTRKATQLRHLETALRSRVAIKRGRRTDLG